MTRAQPDLAQRRRRQQRPLAWAAGVALSLVCAAAAGQTDRGVPAAVQGSAPAGQPSTFIEPRELVDLGGRLLFNAFNDEVGQALWVLDPGSGAVDRLTEMRPGFRGAAPSSITVFDGRAFFAADDGWHGMELWSSDGTKGGTAIVKDLFAGEAGSIPNSLSVFGDRLFFVARSGAESRLWKTGGSAGTTEPVRAEPGLRNPRQLTRVGSRLFFTARDEAHGQELWVIDSPQARRAWCSTFAAGRRIRCPRS